MDWQTYKHLKEQFVANLPGTSKWEVLAATSCLPLSVIVVNHIEQLLVGVERVKSWWQRLLLFVVEFILLVVPSLLIYTGALEATLVFTSLASCWVGLVALCVWHSRARPDAKKYAETIAFMLLEPRKQFISAFRGVVMIQSVLCILAVDFPAFPRRYGKVERWGTGLMDVGVGAMVVASGLVNRAAQREAALKNLEWTVRLGQGIRAAAPLWVLGFARTIGTKAVGYQEHVGEYGVHWNFFFTMAFIVLLTYLIQLPATTYALVGRTFLMGHQLLLAFGADALPLNKATTGVSHWVHSDERGSDMLSQNKEGIVSLPGYLALYLLATNAGNFIKHASRYTSTMINARISSNRTPYLLPLWMRLLQAVFINLAMIVFALLIGVLVEPVSRRACNSAYVMWILSQSVTMLAILMVTQVFSPHGEFPQLLNAFNRNMLPMFLLGNLLTGAVNFGMNTLETGDGMARIVVGVYMLALSGVAVVADYKDFTIRLW